MRKKYLLVKFENIKKKHVPLIAELRETCIYAAVYTEDKDIGDKEVITARTCEIYGKPLRQSA